MAEHMSNAARKMTIQGGFLLLMFAAAPVNFAESFADPTRPPASLGVAQDGAISAPAPGPVLQSVLISPGRMVAVISGKTVSIGEKFGEARVIKITETEVQLRNGTDLQTLKLFPGIEKRLTSRGAGTKPDNRGQPR
jgi:MSHA biogenesis protein MshK